MLLVESLLLALVSGIAGLVIANWAVRAVPAILTESLPGVSDVSLDIRRGEIVGLAGLVGAGRSELARVLFGITPADSGEIRLDGKPVHFRSPMEARLAGVGGDADEGLLAVDHRADRARHLHVGIVGVEGGQSEVQPPVEQGGAIADLVGDDAGLLTTPGDDDALRDALARIVGDRVLRSRLADGARRRRACLRGWDEAAGDMASALAPFSQHG